MNPFIKSNKPWLSLLGLAVIIVILGFIFKPKEVDFKTNANQAVKLISESQMQVSITNLAGKQLIDIRPADLFAQGHPENAINIPARNLLDKEALELLDDIQHSGQEAVLYGSDELQAIAPALLLAQMGYSNVKYVKGGFKNNGEFKETESANDEKTVVDMKSAQANSSSVISGEVKPEKKKSEAVIPVKKQASSGGGC
jgi:rhodanese-related sulfurtransferase